MIILKTILEKASHTQILAAMDPGDCSQYQNSAAACGILKNIVELFEIPAQSINCIQGVIINSKQNLGKPEQDLAKMKAILTENLNNQGEMLFSSISPQTP